MTREEAIAIAHSDPEVIVEVPVQFSARIDELERKIALLTRDSSNSSKSPSSDGPGTKLRPRRAKQSKKRNPGGGQPGHKGTNRDLIPIEDVDHVIPVFPHTCEHFGTPLSQDSEQPTGKYWRHQVMDIPEPKPEVTEYQLRCIRCSCGAENWPKTRQAARSGFGPRLAAFLAHLTGRDRVTRRGCQEIGKTIFAIDICLGSVCKLHEEVSEALASAHERARQVLPEQPVLNADETGWTTQGNRRWLWLLTTPVVAYFHIAASQGAKVLREILGDEYKGTLCSDMYAAYRAFHKGICQFCWVHIIRAIKGIKHGCRSPDAVKFVSVQRVLSSSETGAAR